MKIGFIDFTDIWEQYVILWRNLTKPDKSVRSLRFTAVLLPCRAGACRHSAPGPASQTQQVFADADYWAKSDSCSEYSCTFFENSRLKNTKNLEPLSAVQLRT